LPDFDSFYQHFSTVKYHGRALEREISCFPIFSLCYTDALLYL